MMGRQARRQLEREKRKGVFVLRRVRPITMRERMKGHTGDSLPDSKRTVDPWTWTATQPLPWAVRARRRQRNRIASATRKAQR